MGAASVLQRKRQIGKRRGSFEEAKSSADIQGFSPERDRVRCSPERSPHPRRPPSHLSL